MRVAGRNTTQHAHNRREGKRSRTTQRETHMDTAATGEKRERRSTKSTAQPRMFALANTVVAAP